MSLIHTFALVPSADLESRGWWSLSTSKWRRGRSVVQIHDDLLHYTADTLNWISSYNPSTKKAQRGLNFWGVTVIRGGGARTAARMFADWAALIENAPSPLRLTGHYEKTERKEGYQKLVFDRDATVKSFKQLSRMCRKIDDSAGRFCLLHMGI